jgi:hypothetical protein
MKTIYFAMAELPDGTRIFERAYTTHAAAKAAIEAMIKDVVDGNDWEAIPMVEEVELVDE